MRFFSIFRFFHPQIPYFQIVVSRPNIVRMESKAVELILFIYHLKVD